MQAIKAILYELSAHIQNTQCLSAHNTHSYMCVHGIGAMHESEIDDFRIINFTLCIMENVNNTFFYLLFVVKFVLRYFMQFTC